MEERVVLNNKLYTVDEVLDQFPDFGFYCLFSKRNTGKTKMVRNLVVALLNQHLKNGKKVIYDHIIVFSDTGAKKRNDDYAFLYKFPQAKIYDCSEETINKIIGKLEAKIDQIIQKGGKRPKVLIIFDDVRARKSNQPPESLTNLATQGRHIWCTCILSLQMTKGGGIINPTIRSNIDEVFFSKLPKSGRELMYEYICEDIDKKDFEKFVKENTKNYQFVLIDNNNNGDAGDTVKLVKAKLFKEIKLKVY